MSNIIKKTVNVYPLRPIPSVGIQGATLAVELTIPQIRACLNARATVEEVLKDGSTINLNYENIEKDNLLEKKRLAEEKLKKADTEKNLKTAINAKDIEIKGLNASLKAAQEAESNAKLELADLKKQLDETNKKVEDLIKENKTLQSKVDDLTKENASLKNTTKNTSKK